VDLLSEEEQWENMRAWMRKNGAFLVGVVALSLLAVAGWRWWQGRVETSAVNANLAYEKILQSFDANQNDAALSQIEALRRDYPKSAYVTTADLAAVRVFVSRNELDKAEPRLKSVLDTTRDEQLKPIVRLRLARVQSALGRNDDALATLGTASQGAHEPAYAEARGDIRLAKGDKAGALREYEAARAALPAEGRGTGVDVLLDLKINDLRSEGVTVAAPTAAAPAAAAPAATPAAPASPAPAPVTR